MILLKQILNSKGLNIKRLFLNSESSSQMSLNYRNSRLLAKVHKAGETSATAAFPFVPFLSWRNTTASRVTEMEESIGPYTSILFTKFCILYSND